MFTINVEGGVRWMEVFLMIVALIVFGVEEILHGQYESRKRADENMRRLRGLNSRSSKRG